jgi:predicted DCC family thiol-disulfide oxidoreductase YuxK
MAECSAQPPVCNEGRHLLLFDGVCALCSRMVQFILAADRRRLFRFASLQSAAGRAAVRRVGGDPDTLNTLYVIADYRTPDEKGLIKGQAQLFILETLGWPWKAAAVVGFLPVAWLDRLYDVIARHRYRVFGRYEQCLLPRPEHRGRFMDSQPGFDQGERAS